MKPQKVSISCDLNPFYLEFWEPVSRIWKYKFGIEPNLFFVGKEQDAPKSEHGKVTVVEPVEGIPIHTQTQWARFYFMQTDAESVWITSDIDMFPLSKSYFFDMVENVPEDAFVSLNSDMENYFPVCYNMAKGKLFKKILDLSGSFRDSVSRVYQTTSSDSHSVDGKVCENWSSDERYSSRKICEYRSLFPHKVFQCLRPGGFHGGRRIDRNNWNYNDSLVTQEWYLDCHSIRPYSENKEKIERLIRIAMQ